MENFHVCYDHWLFKITMWLNPNHPSMAHLVASDYPKCNRKCHHKLGFHIIHGNG